MNMIARWIGRKPTALPAEGQDGGGTPDGQGGHGNGGGEPPKPSGPRNPWQPPVTGGSSPSGGPRRPASLEDIFRARGGGGGGNGGGSPSGPPPRGGAPFRLPQRPDGKSWTPLVLGGLALFWVAVSSSHQLSSNEEGIVTTFGKYSGTIGPGMNLTAPWPIQRVRVEAVTSINRISLPDGEAENLMLTGDQSLVDLSYIVRWNIKNLKQYSYQMKDPEGTVREVAEAAMRASVAEVKLADVMNGSGRGEIEAHVRQRMQAVLDAYRAGINVQGVDIKKADPPGKVNGAFQNVQAAQQDYNRDVSNAQAYAQQIKARAEADASQFDKIYEQYKLAPEVTRRRLYYETMERVLMSNDKVVAPSGGMTSYLPLPEIRKKVLVSPDSPPPQGGAQ